MKKYCALFTSFASRAVHLEVTNALDTVRSIRSDNGTNFVGAPNELRKALDETNHEQVKHYLQKNGSVWVTWENNPRTASHFGGIWEHQIRTIIAILDALLKTHLCSLNNKNFRTVLAETEGIINSRPLTVETLSDANSQILLSPSNLLTHKTSIVLPPPGNFDRPHLYLWWNGDKFNISLRNFSQVGEINFFRALRSGKMKYKKTKL